MVHTLCDDRGGKKGAAWCSVSCDKDLRAKGWDSVHGKVTSQFDYLLYTRVELYAASGDNPMTFNS
jgi:hypothetical protein